MAKIFNLNERLAAFASSIIGFAEKLPKSFAAQHLAGQLIRSGTAPALHYGEAQAGESGKDFIHKMRTGLKELRETLNALRIIQLKNWMSKEDLDPVIDENNQLIAIFVTCIKTALRNSGKDKLDE